MADLVVVRRSPQVGDEMPPEVAVRVGPPLAVAWLIIGGLAAGQRHYYAHFDGSCGRFATIGAVVISGPLNYAGLNPWVACRVPQPSR